MVSLVRELLSRPSHANSSKRGSSMSSSAAWRPTTLSQVQFPARSRGCVSGSESGYSAKDVKSYIRQRTAVPAGAVPVTHLHGYAGRDETKGTLVLSEEHY